MDTKPSRNPNTIGLSTLEVVSLFIKSNVNILGRD